MNVVVPIGCPNLSDFADHAKFRLGSPNWVVRRLDTSDVVRRPELSPGPWFDHYVVVSESIAQLRQILPLFSAEGSTRRLTVCIERSITDLDSWGRAGASGAFEWERLSKSDSGDISHMVRYQSSEWRGIHDVLVDIATPSRRHWSLPLRGRRLGVSAPEWAAWSAGDPQARWIDENLSLEGSLPANSVDSALVTNGRLLVHPDGAPGTVEELRKVTGLSPVDTVICSPQGFLAYPGEGSLRIEPADSGGRWRLLGGQPVGFDVLDEGVIQYLRSFHSVEIVDPLELASPRDSARLLSQIAAAGIPAAAGGVLTDAVADLLGPEVTRHLSEYADARFPDVMSRESASINCRRAALQRFSPAVRWEAMLPRPGVDEPTVSILLPTRRPELLPRILKQIAGQTLEPAEVVVGLHGHEISLELEQLAQESGGRLVIRHFPPEVSLGVVLNGLTDLAKGRLVSKMDDDDWYGPHHIEDLVLGMQYSGAGLVGTAVEFVYLEAIDITTRRDFVSECFSDHVAGGTILISKELLLSVGGWRLMRSAVDRGLIDSVRASGESVYRIHGQNYLMHRRGHSAALASHTWETGDEVFLRNSVEQWRGFCPPPQFEMSANWFTPPGRGTEHFGLFGLE